MELDRLLFSFFNADVAARYWPDIVNGFIVTTYLGAAVIAAGLASGLALAMARSFHFKPLNFFIVVFADAFRALPPLVVIIVLFFAFPYVDLAMSAFTATWLALSLVLAAFAEEIFWAGILAVPKGQSEAARSTGMSRFQTLAFVVLPQAVRLTIPPLTNRMIAITKNTALGSVVAVHEIIYHASSASSLAGNPTPLTLGALAYLVLFLPVVLFSRWIETRFAWKR
ncbi:MAG TPA: amino acid ABC transporter permease [Burkholderiales bacterium]|nr:amino acid ABC transporter permease [Burkholderiales bacterium]